MKSVLQDLQRLTEEHLRNVAYEHAKAFFAEEYGVDFDDHLVVMPQSWAEKAGMPWLKNKVPANGLLSSPHLPSDRLVIMKKGGPIQRSMEAAA